MLLFTPSDEVGKSNMLSLWQLRVREADSVLEGFGHGAVAGLGNRLQLFVGSGGNAVGDGLTAPGAVTAATRGALAWVSLFG